jgi:hypothetical protein
VVGDLRALRGRGHKTAKGRIVRHYSLRVNLTEQLENSEDPRNANEVYRLEVYICKVDGTGTKSDGSA